MAISVEKIISKRVKTTNINLEIPIPFILSKGHKEVSIPENFQTISHIQKQKFQYIRKNIVYTRNTYLLS